MPSLPWFCVSRQCIALPAIGSDATEDIGKVSCGDSLYSLCPHFSMSFYTTTLPDRPREFWAEITCRMERSEVGHLDGSCLDCYWELTFWKKELKIVTFAEHLKQESQKWQPFSTCLPRREKNTAGKGNLEDSRADLR
ncbi:uncharacterized protein BDR25DRAFT_361111 [Lindgomyces ingoldianus]|uniref:Uncharacterized protein n=1 Tax=Lindgomyces ingoldianus TaxID=673940 RepID=A0ACB6QCX5_9PLEO|nr:uncharacterized protein BDR25DRAFT_361111 [Lindgomyces ingoldianus]KAF2464879.1 hypothetical protein BDR25DRAFT_361111 [Lindgomyces ingoldianus]